MNSASASHAPAFALDDLCIDTLRFLSVDAAQKANSRHPDHPLGGAPMAHVLRTRFLKHDPAERHWFDRDRFVPSAGHGSMLLYSLLHVTDYEVSREQIKQFRQWGSLSAGHPDRGPTPGVEVTTGPLGQGFGNGVGMATAHLAARENRDGFEIIDHCTYAIVSDGDLMEGVAPEAVSPAGHLQPGKRLDPYDDNRVTLSAGIVITFTEDRARRFEAFGGRVSDSGEGRWTLPAAIDEAMPAPVLGAARYERFASRGEADFAGQALSGIHPQVGEPVEPERKVAK